MKLRVKLPDGSCLEFEKKPMSHDTKESLWMAVMFLSVIGSMLLLIWLLR